MNLKEIKFLLMHSSIYGLGTMISQAVSFIMLPIYTRHLTPKDYGILEMIDTTNMLIGIAVTIGIGRGMSRFYYEEENSDYRNQVISTTYGISFAITIMLFPILYFLSPYFSQLIFSTLEYKQYFSISFFSLFMGAITDIGLIYYRLEKQPVHFITVSITRLISLIILNIIFIVYLHLGVMGILLSTLLSRITYSLIISTAILWKTKFRFSLKIAKKLISFCAPLIPANLFSTLIKQSDKYFVLYLMTVADAGIYSLSLKLGNAVHILITVPFIMAYIPRRFEIMKKPDAVQTYAQIFTYFSFLFILIGLSISVLIPEIIRIMATSDFYEAEQYIPLVVFSMYIFACQYHFDFGIEYSKKTKYFAYINVIIAGLHLSLNFFLISNYGIWGAVCASIIVLGFQSIFYLLISQKFYRIDYELARIARFLFLAVVFYFFSAQIKFSNILLDTILKSHLLILFLIVAALLNIVKKAEVTAVKELIHRRLLQKKA